MVIGLLSILGAWSTYWTSSSLSISPIRSSAGISLMSYLFLLGMRIFYPIDVELYGGVIFGASFVGMSSKDKLSNGEIIIAAIIYSMIFEFFTGRFEGIGGTLGFCAFCSVVLTKIARETMVFFKAQVS